MNAAAETFRAAARACRDDPRREGNVVHLTGKLNVVVAGDIHGNLRHLAAILAHADLAARPDRRLILQEVLHGKVDPRTGRENSIDALLRAARLLATRPEQVVCLLGNHDVAQVTGNELVKFGGRLCAAFEAGVRHAFGDDAGDVLDAVHLLLRSLPLAVRCDNDVWITHSLPKISTGEEPDTDVLQRPYRPVDFARGGAVYNWTWGRGQTPESIEALADALGAKLILFGHLHVTSGIEPIGERGVTLTSEHPNGRIVEFATTEPLDAAGAVAASRRIATLGA
ncbi:MAG: metallophosphoesterase [Phycisphaerae bacterium]|nr:metallophosphoesterase [Phycisphaerae bacterium]